MKRILITGAGGFIGSNLADELLERGDEVVGLDNFNAQYDPRIKRDNIAGPLERDSYRLVEGDICDEEMVMDVFRRECPEVVVHLAAATGVRNSYREPRLCYQVNIIGTQIILDACRAHFPSHVVLASSSTVYDDRGIPFSEDTTAVCPLSP